MEAKINFETKKKVIVKYTELNPFVSIENDDEDSCGYSYNYVENQVAVVFHMNMEHHTLEDIQETIKALQQVEKFMMEHMNEDG